MHIGARARVLTLANEHCKRLVTSRVISLTTTLEFPREHWPLRCSFGVFSSFGLIGIVCFSFVTMFSIIIRAQRGFLIPYNRALRRRDSLVRIVSLYLYFEWNLSMFGKYTTGDIRLANIQSVHVPIHEQVCHKISLASPAQPFD